LRNIYYSSSSTSSTLTTPPLTTTTPSSTTLQIIITDVFYEFQNQTTAENLVNSIEIIKEGIDLNK
jgi:hypothetical protein